MLLPKPFKKKLKPLKDHYFTKLGGVSCKPSIFFLFLFFCCQPGFSGLAIMAPDFLAKRTLVPSSKYANLVLVAFLIK